MNNKLVSKFLLAVGFAVILLFLVATYTVANAQEDITLPNNYHAIQVTNPQLNVTCIVLRYDTTVIDEACFASNTLVSITTTGTTNAENFAVSIWLYVDRQSNMQGQGFDAISEAFMGEGSFLNRSNQILSGLAVLATELQSAILDLFDSRDLVCHAMVTTNEVSGSISCTNVPLEG